MCDVLWKQLTHFPLASDPELAARETDATADGDERRRRHATDVRTHEGGSHLRVYCPCVLRCTAAVGVEAIEEAVDGLGEKLCAPVVNLELPINNHGVKPTPNPTRVSDKPMLALNRALEVL
jgi:hypothetical protein